MMKKMPIIILLISLILTGCAKINIDYKNHKEQTLFTENKSLEQNLEKEQMIMATSIKEDSEIKVKPPTSISFIEGKEKLNIVSEKYPEFYGQLYKKFLNYELGKIKDFVDMFYPYSTDKEFLFNKYIDEQITANTKITIADTYFYNDKLTIDLVIEYLPVYFNMLKNNANIENITHDYLRYSKIDKQRDFFVLEFDISKFSSSEGVKIKNYPNKEAIVRSLTNSFYGANKEFIMYSDENKQEEIDKIIENLKDFKFDNLSEINGISSELNKIVSENNDLAKYIYDNLEIKSINMEYIMITYPNVQAYILEHSPSMDELMTVINENKIGNISRLIYDPDFSRLYKMINNMFL